MRFNLRCRADVPITIEPDNSGTPQAIDFVNSLQQYRPKQKSSSIYTEVATNYGSFINLFNVFEMGSEKPGNPIYLPVLGPGKYHEFPACNPP